MVGCAVVLQCTYIPVGKERLGPTAPQSPTGRASSFSAGAGARSLLDTHVG